MQREQSQQEFFLLNSLPLGIFILDRRGCFTFVNETAGRFFQALSGRPPGEIIGQSIGECCQEFADSTFIKEYEQARAGLRTFELEAFYPGLERWFLILASFTEHGQCFTLQDITAQKRLEMDYRNRLDHLAAALDARAEYMVQVAKEMGDALALLRNDCFLTRQEPKAVAQAAAVAEQK
jgi:PAS domain-containing protein